jgi:hypothetical protein
MFMIRGSRPCLQLARSSIKSKSLDEKRSRVIRRATTSKIGYYSFATIAVATSTRTIMASPTKIQLDPNYKPAFAVSGLTEENARKASELLQKNHEEHHIFFNKDGFHVRCPPPPTHPRQN